MLTLLLSCQSGNEGSIIVIQAGIYGNNLPSLGTEGSSQVVLSQTSDNSQRIKPISGVALSAVAACPKQPPPSPINIRWAATTSSCEFDVLYPICS